MPAPQGYVALDLVGFTDKGDYAAGTTYAQNDLVHSDNRIYLSLQDNNVGQALPVSPATETAFWRLWLSGGGDDLEALTAEDTSNVTGGGAGQVVVAQTLIDAIANKVMNDLIAKSQIINNLLATQAGNVLDATQGKVLKDELDQLNSDLNNRNDVSDLLAEANIGANSKRIVCCGELTLNTPYKAGLVPGSQGIAYINMANENYGTIMYIASGGNDVFLRKKSSGTWDTNWTKLITNADLADAIKAFSVTVTAPAADGKVSVTATIPEGYRFLCWLQSITTGWVGNSNPASQLATTDFYTSIGSGGNLVCWYLVVKD